MKKFAVIFLSFMLFSFSTLATEKRDYGDLPNLTHIMNVYTYDTRSQKTPVSTIRVPKKISLKTPTISMSQGARDIVRIVEIINELLDPTPAIEATKQMIKDDGGKIHEYLMTPNEQKELTRIEEKAIKGEKLTSDELFFYAEMNGLKEELKSGIELKKHQVKKQNRVQKIKKLFN